MVLCGRGFGEAGQGNHRRDPVGDCADAEAENNLVLGKPTGPVVYLFEPILQVRSRRQTTIVAQTDFWSGTGMTPTAFNWWRFVR